LFHETDKTSCSSAAAAEFSVCRFLHFQQGSGQILGDLLHSAVLHPAPARQARNEENGRRDVRRVLRSRVGALLTVEFWSRKSPYFCQQKGSGAEFVLGDMSSQRVGSQNLNALNSFFYKATTEDDVIRDGEESAYLFDAIERIGHCECLCW
jgi:hypothetical protein